MSEPPRCLVEQLDGDHLVVDRAAAHHLHKVLRLRRGDPFVGVDGRGGAVLARWQGPEPAPVEQRWPTEPAPTAPLWLAVAPPRPSRLDWLVEKATELAVDRIIPLRTQRAVRPIQAERRLRLQRKADEALLQCRRLHRLVVEDMTDLDELLTREGPAARWLARAPVDDEPPPAGPTGRPDGPLLLCVGPEGGFTPDELQQITARGARPVSAGPHVLRVETAALALATLAAVTPIERGAHGEMT